MWSHLSSRWHELPTWAKWVVGITGIVFVDAVISASDERNFVAGTAETFVALLLHYGTMVAAFASAIWLGIKIANKSGHTWIGWASGLIVFVGWALIVTPMITAIPGVGWRIEAIMNSDCYTDWDGRSNPTVCE